MHAHSNPLDAMFVEQFHDDKEEGNSKRKNKAARRSLLLRNVRKKQ